MYHEIVDVELTWVQPRRSKPRFELRFGEHVLATLTGHKGGRALGQWGEQCYWFSQEGWFRRRTIVRNAASDADDTYDANAEPLALFVHQGSGGTLVFPDGRLLTWKKPKMWTSERVWVDAASTAMVRYRLGAWRSSVTVMIEPQAATQPEIPLLVLLGQYLHVRAAQDEETASVVASVVPVISS